MSPRANDAGQLRFLSSLQAAFLRGGPAGIKPAGYRCSEGWRETPRQEPVFSGTRVNGRIVAASG